MHTIPSQAIEWKKSHFVIDLLNSALWVYVYLSLPQSNMAIEYIIQNNL